MAAITSGERRFSKAWLVLAVVLVLFFVALAFDRIIATLVPTYTGIFNNINLLGPSSTTPTP